MRVLSLFDGIACGKVALEEAGVKITQYFSSEICPNAIKVAARNHRDILPLGDVNNINFKDFKGIDLVMGGSPCTNLSFAGKREGFKGESALFWKFVEAVREAQPRYFLLENTRMKKEYIDTISQALKVKPLFLDSAMFSAQRRERIYWTNIPFSTLWTRKWKGPTISSILVDDVACIPMNYSSSGRGGGRVEGRYTLTHKALTLTKTGYTKRSNTALYKIVDKIVDGTKADLYRPQVELIKYRDLTAIEWERLQGLPDNYTYGIPEKKRKEVIGNGWNVPTLAYIFKGLVKE